MKILIFEIDKVLTNECMDQRNIILGILHYAYQMRWGVYIVTARIKREYAEERKKANRISDAYFNRHITKYIKDINDDVPEDISNAFEGIFESYSYGDNFKNEFDTKRIYSVKNYNTVLKMFERFTDKFEENQRPFIDRTLTPQLYLYHGICKMYNIEQIKNREELKTGRLIDWSDVYFFDGCEISYDSYLFWSKYINQKMSKMIFIRRVARCVFDDDFNTNILVMKRNGLLPNKTCNSIPTEDKKIVIFDLDNLDKDCFGNDENKVKMLMLSVMYNCYRKRNNVYAITSGSNSNEHKPKKQIGLPFASGDIEKNIIDKLGISREFINGVAGVFGDYSFDGFKDYKNKLEFNKISQWFYYSNFNWEADTYYNVRNNLHNNTTELLDTFMNTNKDVSVKIDQLTSIKQKENVRWNQIYFFNGSDSDLKIFRLWANHIDQSLSNINYIGGPDFSFTTVNKFKRYLCLSGLLDIRLCN